MRAYRRCEVCFADLSEYRADAIVCSPKCRQALRRRRLAATEPAETVTEPAPRALAPAEQREAADHWDPAVWHPVDEQRW